MLLVVLLCCYIFSFLLPLLIVNIVGATCVAVADVAKLPCYSFYFRLVYMCVAHATFFYLILIYCVGALLQPCQFPGMYFLVCELCVCTSCCVWVPFGTGVAGC